MCIWFRVTDFSSWIFRPKQGVDGRYDVDGLRSRAVAFARQTVAAGLWRSNYITISAWADRTYGRPPPT